MADLEFFFDPVCPWAWITSRWVVEVQQQRDYDVQWRFISLKVINQDLTADWYTPNYRAAHMAGLYAHRVCDEVRMKYGNAEVAALYTALGTAFHRDQRRTAINDDPVGFMSEMLVAVDLPTELAAHALDESHDAFIAEETELAFARTGRDVGTPIITFRPGRADEASFFGPVISTIPRGEEATRLWDAIELIATSSGMSELKRSNRAAPQFD
ncbi:MAG: DsbA family protein [Actinomycetota bacterium]|nr:DsbA family protein [Actinomycetota bacterium]